MNFRLGNKGYLTTENPLLDVIFNGGFQYNTMSHYYGGDSTGKSTFAMQLALVTVHNGYEVIWIDLNNSFNFNRLTQMNNGDTAIASQIKLFKPQSYEINMELIKKLETYVTDTTKLIVLDPFIYFYRLYSQKNVEFRTRRDLFNVQLPILARIVLTYDLHIILINQIRANFGKDSGVSGGQRTNKFCKYVLEFQKHPIENKRMITIHRIFRRRDPIYLSCQIGNFGFYGFKLC
ncbi:MAG: hypothetical protein ACFFD2_23660 [Promethearchaeota archaeon]